MFLFKRKKENDGGQVAEATKAELIRPDKSKKGNPEKGKGKTIEPESVVETIEKGQAEVKEAPVKVVVPASALKEEEPKETVAAAASAPAKPAVPDDVADSFLKPGHEIAGKPAAAPAPAAPKVAAPQPAAVSTPAAAPQPAAVPTPAAVPQPAAAEAKKSESKPDAPKAEEKKAAEGENLFSSLFSKAVVEEENALDRLIKALPDITMEEVLTEADEVKNLMREFSHYQDG
jgi:hypothetical protein